MTVHVGLIGGGNISGAHARAATAIPDVKISAVHGTNLEKNQFIALRVPRS